MKQPHYRHDAILTSSPFRPVQHAPAVIPVLFCNCGFAYHHRAWKTFGPAVHSRASHHGLGHPELVGRGHDRTANYRRLPGTRTRGLPCRLRIRRPCRSASRVVKLLFDENLSRKLGTRLADLYPGSLHLANVSMLEAPDSAVWAYARRCTDSPARGRSGSELCRMTNS